MKEHKQLLHELSQELQTAGELDPETREVLQKIGDDIDAGFLENTLEQLKLLESQFAAYHPTAERITQNLLDALAKMGI